VGRVRILYLEDDPRDVELVRAALSGGPVESDLTHVTSVPLFERALSGGPWDILLSAYAVQGPNGLQALEIARRLNPEIPFVFVSGTIGEDQAIECLRMGATDYVLKDRLGRLGAAIERALREAGDRARGLRVEEELGRLASIVEVTSDFVGICDLAGLVIYLNGAAHRLLEIPDGEAVALTPISRFHPAWAASIILDEGLPAASRDGSWRGETALLTRNGRQIPASQVILAHKDAEGVVGYFSTIVRDITDRKRTEEDLKASLRRHAVISNLGLRALATDDLRSLTKEAVATTCRVLDVELAAVLELTPDCRSFTMTAGEGWKEGIAESLSLPAGTETVAGVAVASRAPVIVQDLRAEVRFTGSDVLRDHGVVSAVSVVIQGQRGPYGVFGAYTSRARRFGDDEIHFMQAVANLLASAVQRHQSKEALRSSEEQLRLAQKMEAIGRLAGGIAHDFNNLLTVITGYAEFMLERLATPDPLHEQASQILKAGERASALTRQLLAFSRRQVLHFEVVDLNAAVSDLEKMLRRLIGEDVHLITSLADDLGSVKVDRGQMEQVLMNLAINARDAMPKGGTLSIGTSNGEEDDAGHASAPGAIPGPFVTLSMTDTGVGMDLPTQARIFEPFFTTKKEGKGTGLGLSTVYGIVKQSGGHIRVHSEPGRGAEFKICIPRVRGVVEPARRATPSPGAPRGTETILLVEDSQELRVLVRTMLGRAGYTILEAADGLAALAVSEGHAGSIDLLLTDVVMPGMNGREMSERLARRRPRTRILFMSGYTGDSAVTHGVLEERFRFIQKPFTSSSLARVVREVLDAPVAAPTAPSRRRTPEAPPR
jgi:PAS domain S-box-containing protein